MTINYGADHAVGPECTDVTRKIVYSVSQFMQLFDECNKI